MSKQNILKGTIIFASAGIFCRVLGFIFRIYISRILTGEQIGLYQLVFPIGILGQSIAVGGLSTAITRNVAAHKANDRIDKGFINMMSTLFYSLLLSIIIAIIVEKKASFLAKHIFMNQTCADLIKIMAISIPFACVHTIIASYFIGLELHKYTAISQVIEQIIRMSFVYLIARFYNRSCLIKDSKIAVFGILAGEIGACIYSIIALSINKKRIPKNSGLIRSKLYYYVEYFNQLRKNISFSVPLTFNRISMHLIQSLETILLPMMLVVYGLAKENALSLYGVLTGMTLPLLFFPATITNSMSQALLPDISKSHELKDYNKLNESINLALKTASFLGIFSIPAFYFYGARIGSIIFKNELIIHQIQMLCLICPFIFLIAPLNSILNAIGKSGTVFFSNICTLIIRLITVVFVIPHIGIDGYYYCMPFSLIIACVWQMIVLKKETHCLYSFDKFIIAPLVANILCFFTTFPIYTFLHKQALPEFMSLVCAGSAYLIAYVLLYVINKKYLKIF